MSRSIWLFRLGLTLLLVGGALLGWLHGADPAGSRAMAAGIAAQPAAPVAVAATPAHIRNANVWYYPLMYSEARKTIP